LIQNRAVGGNGFPVAGANGLPGHAYGGGLFTTGEVTLTNCTLALNIAIGGDGRPTTPGWWFGGHAVGGGAYVSNGTLLAICSTLASNSVATGLGVSFVVLPVVSPVVAGANLANGSGTVSLRNTLLAYGGTNGNAAGPITDAGFNMSSDGSANFSSGTSFNSTDPLLGPIGTQYGGLTPVMPLRPNSPAIDAGTEVGVPPIDQRGASRPFGVGVDIGAYEYHSNQTELTRLTIVADASGELKLRFPTWAGSVYQLQAGTLGHDWTVVEVIGPFPISTLVERRVPLPLEAYRFFQTSSPP
jgi:hypothetical protein